MNSDFRLDLRHVCRGLGFYTLYICGLHIIYIGGCEAAGFTLPVKY